nr:uncharacterized protein LOC116832650 [Chelonoidis abingdonii]
MVTGVFSAAPLGSAVPGGPLRHSPGGLFGGAGLVAAPRPHPSLLQKKPQGSRVREAAPEKAAAVCPRVPVTPVLQRGGLPGGAQALLCVPEALAEELSQALVSLGMALEQDYAWDIFTSMMVITWPYFLELCRRGSRSSRRQLPQLPWLSGAAERCWGSAPAGGASACLTAEEAQVLYIAPWPGPRSGQGSTLQAVFLKYYTAPEAGAAPVAPAPAPTTSPLPSPAP